ncbi:hypothetical protein SLEP1_g9736 [Rubroshorea leprosula]|uniref:Uncharacterized protein n=1 Tax=Rubroshorea leprosula TaxID=152421 RepID=A0AAV5IF45_9ROSI|nr:hypothetical protein SLEP1_g9736 [Rubroshorea leprosula]
MRVTMLFMLLVKAVMSFNKLFNQWSDTSEYLHNKCQNVLHIAAKNGKDYMVRHIVKDKKFGSQLVNAKDFEGNTPLHLAAMHGHSLVVGTLLLTGKCDSQILNQEGFTAYEVAKQRAGDPMDLEHKWGNEIYRAISRAICKPMSNKCAA